LNWLSIETDLVKTDYWYLITDHGFKSYYQRIIYFIIIDMDKNIILSSVHCENCKQNYLG